MKPGFKVANELAQEIVEIARFIIAAFDVGREVGEIQGPAIEKTNSPSNGSNLLQLGSKADSSGSRERFLKQSDLEVRPVQQSPLPTGFGCRRTRIESDLIGLSDGGKPRRQPRGEAKLQCISLILLSRYNGRPTYRKLGVLQNGNDPANGIRFRWSFGPHPPIRTSGSGPGNGPPFGGVIGLPQTEVNHGDLGRSFTFKVSPLGCGGDGTIGFVQFVEEAHDVLEPLAQTNFGV